MTSLTPTFTPQASTARRKKGLRPSDARRNAAKLGRSTEVLLFILNFINLLATVLVRLNLAFVSLPLPQPSHPVFE